VIDMNLLTVAVNLTTTAWLALEAYLWIRDRVRGKGSKARDAGTRGLVFLVSAGAAAAAALSTLVTGHGAAWQFGSDGLDLVGLVVMWAGLALRVWAVAVLGASFRTTVEVDAGQPVVDSGPYRWVRHPSYTGVVVMMAGLALIDGTWLALAILLVVPTAVLIRRILIEEAVMTEVLGRAYTDYAAGTKRLVPGLW
jgi:protein-S-isoprenylcysteine O-methyltransferase Ste14